MQGDFIVMRNAQSYDHVTVKGVLCDLEKCVLNGELFTLMARQLNAPAGTPYQTATSIKSAIALLEQRFGRILTDLDKAMMQVLYKIGDTTILLIEGSHGVLRRFHSYAEAEVFLNEHLWVKQGRIHDNLRILHDDYRTRQDLLAGIAEAKKMVPR